MTTQVAPLVTPADAGTVARLRAAALAFLAACVAAGCASAPAPREDAAARAARTVEGFRETSPDVDALLARAAAWAVFHGVEDGPGEWAQPGLLFAPPAAPREVLLRGRSVAPASPARVVYHTLVVLLDAPDAARATAAGLDLTGAVELGLGDALPARAASARRFVVTTSRGGLLFPARSVDHRLEPAPGAPRDGGGAFRRARPAAP